MMQRPMKAHESGKTIQRFGRYPDDINIASLAKQIWKKPKFSVKQEENYTDFNFRFKFSIPEKIREQELASYMLLFELNEMDWERALKMSYSKAYYGTDRVSQLAGSILYKTFVEALGILFEEANKPEGPYRGLLKGDAGTIRELAKRKRRPPVSERASAARRIAARYAELMPQVEAVRKYVRSHRGQFDESKLRVEVEKEFPFDWIKHATQGNALQHLPEIPGHPESTGSLKDLKWTPRQLTVGIIWCEETKRDPNFSVRPNTILDSYLSTGNKLNALSK